MTRSQNRRKPEASIEAKWLDGGTYTGLACPVPGCGTVTQRAEHGTLRDGLNAHLRVVHDTVTVP